jgi:hypothetical protein
MGDIFVSGAAGVLHPRTLGHYRNFYRYVLQRRNYKMSNVWYSIVVVWYPGTVCGYNY